MQSFHFSHGLARFPDALRRLRAEPAASAPRPADAHAVRLPDSAVFVRAAPQLQAVHAPRTSVSDPPRELGSRCLV